MVTDATTKKIIAKNEIVCHNIFSKAKGLMLTSEEAVNDTAWIFPFPKPRRVGITMWFVFYPIDIIFLDDKNMVVEIKEDLRPFGFYMTHAPIYTCVELAHNTVKKAKIRVGHRLRFGKYLKTLSQGT